MAASRHTRGGLYVTLRLAAVTVDCEDALIVKDFLSILPGADPRKLTERIRDWYGYAEPSTVPQEYNPADNPHHRSRYDPLNRLVHGYLPRPGDAPLPRESGDLDLQVSTSEMRDAG